MIKFLRLLLIVFFAFAGTYHFVNPEFYYPLIPEYLPFPKIINYASGVFEILFAVGVAIKKYRNAAALGIVILLVAFVPSHIYFITEGGCMSESLCVPLWVAWVRLIVIHPLLILWAWRIRKD